MYSAFDWRQIRSPGHDELRCVLFLINGTVIEDHLRELVASTPLGTVRSSYLACGVPNMMAAWRSMRQIVYIVWLA